MQARPLLCLSSDFMSSVCVFVLCIFSFYAYFLSIIINVPYIYVTVLYLRVPPKRALTKVEVWDQLGAGVLLQSKLFFQNWSKRNLEPSKNVMELTLYKNEITIQLGYTAHWGHYCVFSLSPFCLHLYWHFLFRLLSMFCLVLYFIVQLSVAIIVSFPLSSCPPSVSINALLTDWTRDVTSSSFLANWRLYQQFEKYVKNNTDEKHQQ